MAEGPDTSPNIQAHSKEEYVKIPQRIQEKSEAKDYYQGNGCIGFLS